MSNSIITYQVLFEIASMLKDLQDNPKALEKAAEDSYALGASEEQKAAQARKDIATNRGLLADIQKNKNDIDRLLLELGEKSKALDAKKLTSDADLAAKYASLAAERAGHKDNVEALKARLNAFNAQTLQVKAEIDAKTAKDTELYNANVAKENDIIKREADLKRAISELDDRQKQIDLYEKNLKSRAAKLREQTEGL